MNSGIRLPKHSSVTRMIMAGNVGDGTSHTSSSVSFDHFKLWKVGELKEFCSARGLPVSGKKKDELVALCYAAATTNLPLVLKKDQEKSIVKVDYGKLLIIKSRGITLPDPLDDLKDGWEGQNSGITKWPPCMYANIAVYLIESNQKGLLDLDLVQ